MDKIDNVLIRGVANIIPDKEKLKKALQDKKLNVYLGIDPTSPKIHLGHAVSLIKLKRFSELGHNAILLIGDFTALIGDTSDKESERPILTSQQIEENFKTYKKQAEKVLNSSKIKIKYNSEWLSKLNFKDILNLVQKFSLNDFMGRELIKKRLREGVRIRLDEVLYPIMQGYDSYWLDTDLQIGGTDQTFNMQTGRILQKKLRNKESYVLATEFLMGTDGRKMSKTLNNAIWLDDSSNDIYAKIMSINDNLIIQYFLLITDVSNEEIEKIKKRLEKENPLNIKKDLAFKIVEMLNGEHEARKAQEHFERTVQKGEHAFQIKTVNLSNSFISTATIAGVITASGISTSMSETKRLIEQGGLTIDGKKINNPNLSAENYFKRGEITIRRGKIKAVRIKLN